jgi:hypothetical protein
MSRSEMLSTVEVRALLYGVCLSFPEQSVALRAKSDELLSGPLGSGKAKVPLPWNGEANSKACQGLRVNHDLFTQCTNAPIADQTFCKTCQSTADKNERNPGQPLYGTVRDRLACKPMEYTVTVNGKEKNVAPYAKIVSKLGLEEIVVRAIAEAHNVALPEDSFTHTSKPPKKLRTKAAVDNDNTPVVEASPASDLVAALVESAKDAPPSRTDIAKAKAGELKGWCTSYALQLGTKKEMQQRLRNELQYIDAPAPHAEPVEEPKVAEKEPVEPKVAEEPTVEMKVEKREEEHVEETLVKEFTQEGLNAITPQFGKEWQEYNREMALSPAVLAEKPVADETDGVEEKEERKVTFEELTYSGGGAQSLSSAAPSSPSSELEEESPLEEPRMDLFTDEKTGNQYMKDDEGRLYDQQSHEEVGLFYGGRVMLDSDLDEELGLTED